MAILSALVVSTLLSALLCNNGSTVSAYSFPSKGRSDSVDRRAALAKIALVSSTPCLLPRSAYAAENILEARLQANSIDSK